MGQPQDSTLPAANGRPEGALSGFLERHPLWSAFLSVLAVKFWLVVMAGISTAAFHDVSPLAVAGGRVLAELAVAIVLYFALRRRKWASIVGFNGTAQWRESWLIWLPSLYVLLNLESVVLLPLNEAPPLELLPSLFSTALSTAIMEETVFRGFILAVLLNRFHSTRAQVVGCVLFAGLLFGAWHGTPIVAHLLGIGPPHFHWETAIAQVIYPVFAAVGFAGVLLRTRSIWWLAGIHALMLIALACAGVLTNAGPESSGTPWKVALLRVVIVLPLLFYGLYLLRDINRLDLRFPR